MSAHAGADASTVIVGASAAGLATAACLQRHGVDYLLLEQGAQVAGRWRTHYDRLHLHTPRGLSGLPYRPMPPSYPRYPSRDHVVAYLEDYAAQLHLAPRFGQTVVSIEPRNGGWMICTPERAYRSRYVVIATGHARQPHRPSFPGLERFGGCAGRKPYPRSFDPS